MTPRLLNLAHFRNLIEELDEEESREFRPVNVSFTAPRMVITHVSETSDPLIKILELFMRIIQSEENKEICER